MVLVPQGNTRAAAKAQLRRLKCPDRKDFGSTYQQSFWYLSLLSHRRGRLGGVSDLVPLPPSAPATVELPVDTAALDRLPGASDTDPFLRLAAAFLAAYPANSARAYRTDLRAWATWCGSLGVHPLAARRHCPRTTSCVGPRTT
jgi:hypothetical protein